MFLEELDLNFRKEYINPRNTEDDRSKMTFLDFNKNVAKAWDQRKYRRLVVSYFLTPLL